jgi:hypothetical protein
MVPRRRDEIAGMGAVVFRDRNGRRLVEKSRGEKMRWFSRRDTSVRTGHRRDQDAITLFTAVYNIWSRVMLIKWVHKYLLRTKTIVR